MGGTINHALAAVHAALAWSKNRRQRRKQRIYPVPASLSLLPFVENLLSA
jgi:hypothetical protein